MPSTAAPVKVRFGPYEFDATAGELRKNGLRIKLQGKSARLLAALLEQPGQVVTREDLRGKLWPDEPFLDFEAGLNTAAKRLRDALSDSAGEPRYIETIPRSGYRFIAEVEDLDSTAAPLLSPVAVPASPKSDWRVAAWVAAGTLLGAAIVWLWPRAAVEQPRFTQVAYRGPATGGARFTPDGKTILYTGPSAAGARVFAANLFAPESREIPDALGSVVSVSPLGEMLLLRASGLTPLGGSSLWRVPLNGGAAVEAERSVFSASWAPDGASIAVARAAGGACRIEYPAGKSLYQTSGYLTNLRFSPDGGEIAFVHHPVRHDEAGSIEVVNRNGAARTLSAGWTSVSGVAWHPRSGEVWFAAGREGDGRSIWAVPSRGGEPRRIYSSPGSLSIHDIAADGSAIISRGSTRLEMAVGSLDAQTATPVTWLDWSSVKDVSPGGELVLFEENGSAVRGKSVAYVHRRSSGATIRLGEGMAMALSEDASQALLLDPDHRDALRWTPVDGPGRPRDWPKSGLTYQWVKPFPGGERLLALAARGADPLRLHVVDATGRASAIAPPGMVRNAAVSPDGTRVAALAADGRLTMYAVAGGDPKVVAADEPLAPLVWTARGLLVQHAKRYTEIPARMSWLNPDTGRVTAHASVAPVDSYGVNAITRIVPSPGGHHWAYSYRRVLSELFWSGNLDSRGQNRP